MASARLNQLLDGLGVGDDALNLGGEVVAQAEIRNVEERVHHRAEQHVVGHQIRSGRTGGLVALANHLARQCRATNMWVCGINAFMI